MYTIYAIESQTKNYMYVGLTDNIERRLSQHNQGHEQTTRPYKPFTLLYTESAPDRKSARTREKYLKSGAGKEFLKKL